MKLDKIATWIGAETLCRPRGLEFRVADFDALGSNFGHRGFEIGHSNGKMLAISRGNLALAYEVQLTTIRKPQPVARKTEVGTRVDGHTKHINIKVFGHVDIVDVERNVMNSVNFHGNLL